MDFHLPTGEASSERFRGLALEIERFVRVRQMQDLQFVAALKARTSVKNFFHLFSGWLVFVVSLLMLFALHRGFKFFEGNSERAS